jgi:hypothetical protein
MATKIFIATIAVLLGLLSVTGFILKNTLKENGELEVNAARWEAANNLTIQAFNNQKAKHEQAQQRMIERESQYSSISKDLNNARSEIEALRGSTDINCVNDAQWLLIENSARYPTSTGLPDHQ